jgi:hypothetical protein
MNQYHLDPDYFTDVLVKQALDISWTVAQLSELGNNIHIPIREGEALRLLLKVKPSVASLQRVGM